MGPRSDRRRSIACACALTAALSIAVDAAKIKTRGQGDPEFDFRTVRTWAWHSDGPGEVKMARASDDDPVAINQRYGPTIIDALAGELDKHGLARAIDVPDVRMHYYLLVTVGFATQERGQFLPSVPEWGVPPFVPATTAFNIVQTGSLVLDAVSTRLDRVVWRGIAETELDTENSEQERHARIREVARALVKRFPRK